MISHLAGTLQDKGLDHVEIDVGGVGFRVAVSLHTAAALPPVGTPAKLLTYLQVREDALALFGFATAEERTAFELCLSVQQVGPKLAMSILSTLTPAELARAVRAGDLGRLHKIPGVGKKTAERLVLELKDKLDKVGLGRGEPGRGAAAAAGPEAGADADAEGQVVSALVNLGYRPAEAERAARSVGGGPELSVTERVRRALRALAE